MSKVEKKFEDYFKIIKHKLPYWDELPEKEKVLKEEGVKFKLIIYS